MKTANSEIKKRFVKYFSEHLYTNEEEIKQIYLSKRIRGLSLTLSLFKPEEIIDSFFNKFIHTVETVMYKDKDTNYFDAFVIQISDNFLFIKKYIKLENSEEYDLITELPFTEIDETEDQFPSITYAFKTN